jgi:uncharacterized protein YndB with AHSA1/START domain
MNAYGTVIAHDTVRIERLLPGPIERVWEYLTDSEKRGRWLASGTMDLRAGSAADLVFHNSALTENDVEPPAKYARAGQPFTMQSIVSQCRPPELLAFSFGAEDDASVATFELTRKGEKVLLVVTHSRIPNRDQMLSYASGWHTHLDILADRLAERVPPGFWATHTRLEAEYAQRIP